MGVRNSQKKKPNCPTLLLFFQSTYSEYGFGLLYVLWWIEFISQSKVCKNNPEILVI